MSILEAFPFLGNHNRGQEKEERESSTPRQKDQKGTRYCQTIRRGKSYVASRVVFVKS